MFEGRAFSGRRKALKRTVRSATSIGCVLVGVLHFCISPVVAQTNLWDHVNSKFSPPNLTQANLSPQQLHAVGGLLRHAPLGGWECSGEELNELIRGLRYEEIPVSSAEHVLLVEAGAGCARGGQGSNGAMWLVRFDGDTPVQLAGPSNDFNGWLYSIQPTENHGYRDLVLGWHMSAAESDLSYFRFDGKMYRSVGSATVIWDDGKGTIAPKAK
jgi:hypothetical protein